MMPTKQDLKEVLTEHLKKVPPAVIDGSWNLSVKYKDWVVKVNKALKGGKANEAILQQLIRQYNSF